MSMQRLRLYLTDHPDERSEILNYNERYVFFRFLPEGPLGNLEVPLTPDRSIATDARLFPKGAPTNCPAVLMIGLRLTLKRRMPLGKSRASVAFALSGVMETSRFPSVSFVRQRK